MSNTKRKVRLCKAENCGLKHYSRGFCITHYWRDRKLGAYNTPTRSDPRPAIIDGDIARVPLGVSAKDGYAIIDAEDADKINEYKWCISRNGYARYANDRRGIFLLMHRYVMGLTDKKLTIDHINMNKLDNRKSNLRICTIQQNQANRLSLSNSNCKYKGVSTTRHGTYRATISVDRIPQYLGAYRTPEQAAIEYDIAAIQVQGEFARTNFL